MGLRLQRRRMRSRPGETLIVRVQYAGEREEKIREKDRFTKSELEAMGASAQRYTNVTRVGTIMAIIEGVRR